MSDSPTVLVVPTGTANLASIKAAFGRLGATVVMAESPAQIDAADRVVLPGVGAFGASMAEVRDHGFHEPLAARIRAGRPTLAVCVGLQLLFETSEESDGVQGLGVLPGAIGRLPHGIRVPHICWNKVAPREGCNLIEPGHAYFANSYRATLPVPEGWAVATVNHGGSFVAAIECGAVLGCQFHPELSGAWGQALMGRWLAGKSSTLNPPAGKAEEGKPVNRVIPCLDVSHGRVVKGVKFQGLRDAGDPAELSARYEAEGADELVLLDVSATTEARGTQVETVRRVRAELSIPLTVGGGVRNVQNAQDLLEAGADKVSVNTAAVERPELVAEIATRFGSQCAVVAIDARRTGDGKFEVLIRSGKESAGPHAVAWARQVVGLGAGELLLTSWDRDGTHEGYDLALVEAVSKAVTVPVIASGGAAGAGHMAEAVAAGADAVLAASIFHDSIYTVEQVKRTLAGHGIEVRL